MFQKSVLLHIISCRTTLRIFKIMLRKHMFYLKFPRSTKNINDEMESIESRIDKASKAYDLKNDVDGTTRLAIKNLHGQFFQLQEKRENILIQFNQLRDLVNGRFTSSTHAMLNEEKVVMLSSVPSNPNEGDVPLIQFETQYHMLGFSKKESWEDIQRIWRHTL